MRNLALYQIKIASSALTVYYLAETGTQAKALFEEQFGEHINIKSIEVMQSPGFVCVVRK